MRSSGYTRLTPDARQRTHRQYVQGLGKSEVGLGIQKKQRTEAIGSFAYTSCRDCVLGKNAETISGVLTPLVRTCVYYHM